MIDAHHSLEPNFAHPIFSEVAALRLPEPDKFVINHSAALDIYGLLGRPYNDIDAAASLRNIRFLRSEHDFSIHRKIVGYKTDRQPVEIIVSQDDDERFDIHRWDFSMQEYRRTGLGRIALKGVISHSIQHPELRLRVAVPGFVLATKVDTGREQDEFDIAWAKTEYGIEPMSELS